MTPEEALSGIVALGIEPVLGSAGFERERRKLRWRRRVDQLDHVVELQRQGEFCAVQWGVISPEFVWFLCGTQPRGDIGEAAMSGPPSSIRHPANAESFWLNEVHDVETLAADLADDLVIVEQWLRPFNTRAELRRYLMLNQDRNDRRGFIVPAHLPRKLYTAAGLAVIDGAPEAKELVAATEEEFAGLGNSDDPRLVRLRAAT